MLTSNDIWLPVVDDAATDMSCAGNGELHTRQFAAACERRIRKGDSYVAQMAILETHRRVPRLLYVMSRHCQHCAPTFFPAVRNVAEAA